MAEVVHMIDSEVFLAFSTYATIVILKMMLMSLLTTSFRLPRKSEDDQKKMEQRDLEAERGRRWCQNDTENTASFVLIGLLYALTGPDLHIALLHFRVFVGSGLVHTAARITALPQPSRALAFSVSVLCTMSMAYRVLCTAFYL